MKENIYFNFTVSLVLSIVLCALLTRYLIPKLKSLKMGQKILEIGPRWHKGKEGTPTMGGLAMIITALAVGAASVILFMLQNTPATGIKMASTLVMAVLYGMIGIIDDRVKLLKKQNEGLTAKQKFLLQLILASAYIAILRITGNLTTALVIPFTDIVLELGVFYYIFALILITGIVNAVNLTDGIDGLASTVTAVVGVFFAVASVSLGMADTAALSGVLTGVCLGFLVYNAYPAKIFMGDTGSLFLGGMTVGLAFMLDSPLIIVLCGLIYIIETLSVMIQVTSFKLTKKRVFKMAPIHHHFEMCGWSEKKIVTVFSLVTAVLCIASYFAL